MKNRILVFQLAAILACGALPALAAEKEYKDMTPAEYRAEVHKNVVATVARFRKVDPNIEKFFKSAAGYVVFPRVGKAGFIFAGGTGDGELYEKGKVLGAASITIASVGLTAGVQEYSEIIFFKDQAALDRFRQNKFEFAASASAVILTAGASKDRDYSEGIAAFTHSTAGAMAEASLGTQKFSFKPDSGAGKK